MIKSDNIVGYNISIIHYYGMIVKFNGIIIYTRNVNYDIYGRDIAYFFSEEKQKPSVSFIIPSSIVNETNSISILLEKKYTIEEMYISNNKIKNIFILLKEFIIIYLIKIIIY